MIGDIILRLLIWFLLTANFQIDNLLIGFLVAISLPRTNASPERLKDLLNGIIKIILAIPQAYIEAFQLIFNPHTEESIVMERTQIGRSPGLVFLDIFLITFTPKTTVLNYHKEGWYEVHQVRPKISPKGQARRKS